MVNLFSFGCHVTDRAYVRTYACTDCTGGVGETIKRKGGVSQARLSSPHLLHWTITIRSIDSCQNSTATEQYPMTISRAHVSTHWGDVIYLEAVRWPVSYFLASLGSEHRKTDTHIGHQCVINWQLSKQDIRWPVSLERIAGSGVDPSRSSIFWSYPLTRYWFSNDRRLKFIFF